MIIPNPRSVKVISHRVIKWLTEYSWSLEMLKCSDAVVETQEFSLCGTSYLIFSPACRDCDAGWYKMEADSGF